MTKKIYAWACDLEAGGGEGDLALAYIGMLKANFPDISLIVLSPRKWIFYKNSKFRVIEKRSLLSTNQDKRQSFFTKYISPFVGIFFLWNRLLSKKNVKLIYLNYLPLWNFFIFIFLPPKSHLGPISGAPYKDFIRYSFSQKIIRRYIFPVFFFISIKAIGIRFNRILVANPMLTDLLEKHKNIIILNDFFSLATLKEIPGNITKTDKSFDLVFYYRRHQSKLPDLTLRVIKVLVNKNLSIAVFGDHANIEGIENFGYQDKSKFLSIMMSSNSIVLIGNNYFTLTYFQALFFKTIPFVFIDKSFNHAILKFLPNEFFFNTLNVEEIANFIDKKYSEKSSIEINYENILFMLNERLNNDFKAYISTL
jgi:hypothetical protein